MDFLNKKIIKEGVVDFAGKKRYMLIYEDGTFGIIIRLAEFNKNSEESKMNYYLQGYESVSGKFVQIYDSYKPLSEGSNLVKRVSLHMKKGVFLRVNNNLFS